MSKARASGPFTWIAFLIFVLTVVIFWVLPNQRPAPEIKVNHIQETNGSN